ncbi:50S ribosomal protein L20 [Finegoldia magna]|uniref:50S ribosomal protein L20 n=1 Tax=Finegoldia magna TaxID=1260 RepID=UPI0037BEF031
MKSVTKRLSTKALPRIDKTSVKSKPDTRPVINAATRMHDLSYSKFMHGLKVAGVDLNRKVLADMAVRDEKEFAKLVELAKNNL